ncbi:uncharacterized protein B0H18DRAFT_961224 [Fomitopsis serialis]|uniref:uncharacterized protein n=1 Tax=Fomitopsis serialis TaxID=139415 RepID=UPI0020081959|nr:uncharacterized protein B0H18DRAFT_961224 [Neoantrodia serialis]KAH9912273.1 hypothetical protein B0H18DRAFT_961224 [Neoantrodia serialis]
MKAIESLRKISSGGYGGAFREVRFHQEKPTWLGKIYKYLTSHVEWFSSHTSSSDRTGINNRVHVLRRAAVRLDGGMTSEDRTDCRPALSSRGAFPSGANMCSWIREPRMKGLLHEFGVGLASVVNMPRGSSRAGHGGACACEVGVGGEAGATNGDGAEDEEHESAARVDGQWGGCPGREILSHFMADDHLHVLTLGSHPKEFNQLQFTTHGLAPRYLGIRELLPPLQLAETRLPEPRPAASLMCSCPQCGPMLLHLASIILRSLRDHYDRRKTLRTSSSVNVLHLGMATRQSLRSAARQPTGQPTTKAKTGQAAVKSAPAAKKSSTATKASSKGATGSKRGRQETPERNGKTSQPDILSPSEKRLYDKLKAKMEQAEKQAAAEHQSNVRRTSTAMLLEENTSGAEDEEDEDEQLRRKKVKKNVEIKLSEYEEQDELVEEEEVAAEAEAEAEEEMRVEPEREVGNANNVDNPPEAPLPPRPKPKPRPAFGRKPANEPEKAKNDRGDTLLDADECNLATALGKPQSSSATSKNNPKARQRNNHAHGDSGSEDDKEQRTNVTQRAKAKKVWCMDAVVIDSPPKKVKITQQTVVNKNKGKGAAVKTKGKGAAVEKNKGKGTRVNKKQKKQHDWLDTDTESENKTEPDADDTEEDHESDSDSDSNSDSNDDDSEEDRDAEDEAMDKDSEDEVIVVKAPKSKAGQSKGKRSKRSSSSAAGQKSEGRRRAQARDIPETLKPIVTCSQMYLCLRLSLDHAWTSEKTQNISQLPHKHLVIKRALKDARRHRAEDGKKIDYLVSGFKTLKKKRNHVLRENVASVVWTGASQLRNEVKKKAKIVVDSAYSLGSLSTQHRVAAATFLLKSNTQGKFSMPNFIFGEIDIAWQSDEPYEVDMKASVVNRKKPFQHKALSDVIVQHWFHGHRDTAPVCNAIEAALVDIATGTHHFSNKLYAANVSPSRQPSEVYQALKEMMWTNVSALINEQQVSRSKDKQDIADDGSPGEQFMRGAIRHLEATSSKPPSSKTTTSKAPEVEPQVNEEEAGREASHSIAVSSSRRVAVHVAVHVAVRVAVRAAVRISVHIAVLPSVSAFV